MRERYTVINIGQLYAQYEKEEDLGKIFRQLQEQKRDDILLVGQAPPWFCVWLGSQLEKIGVAISCEFRQGERRGVIIF